MDAINMMSILGFFPLLSVQTLLADNIGLVGWLLPLCWQRQWCLLVLCSAAVSLEVVTSNLEYLSFAFG